MKISLGTLIGIGFFAWLIFGGNDGGNSGGGSKPKKKVPHASGGGSKPKKKVPHASGGAISPGGPRSNTTNMGGCGT